MRTTSTTTATIPVPPNTTTTKTAIRCAADDHHHGQHPDAGDHDNPIDTRESFRVMSGRRRRPYTTPLVRDLDPEEGRRLILMAAAGEDPGTK